MYRCLCFASCSFRIDFSVVRYCSAIYVLATNQNKLISVDLQLSLFFHLLKWLYSPARQKLKAKQIK